MLVVTITLTLPVVVISVVMTPIVILIADRLVIIAVIITDPWPSVIETDDWLKHTFVATIGKINHTYVRTYVPCQGI